MKDSFWKIINMFDLVLDRSNDSLIIIQMNQIEMNFFDKIWLNWLIYSNELKTKIDFIFQINDQLLFVII